MRARILALIALAAILALASCSIIQQGADALQGAGVVSDSQAKTIKATTQIVRSTFGDITEQEEYYIGRSVAALILSRYRVFQNPGLTQYVNTLGNAVALYSERPETFAGYHVQVLDTDEVNALAAPGGLIFLARGLIARCKDEDSLGLILAHEIGHVSAKHGLQSIKKSRLVEAFKVLGEQAVERYSPEVLGRLTGLFEETLADIVGSLVERGYDRKYEYEADSLALKTSLQAGLDPNGLTRFLKTMVGDASSASGKGWFKTHPTPEQRIDKANSIVGSMGTLPKLLDVRTARFKGILGIK